MEEIKENHIHITTETHTNGAMKFYGFNELTEANIKILSQNPIVKTVQISHQLPSEAYEKINLLLKECPSMQFRMYNISTDNPIDLSFLTNMNYLKHLSIGGDVKLGEDSFNLEILKNLPTLKSLSVVIFNQIDYSFIKDLNKNIEKLTIAADTMGKAIHFDCNWLTEFSKLKTLFLSCKAKKNLSTIANIPNLEYLTLRGIPLQDVYFLENAKNLHSLRIWFCGIKDVTSLKSLTQLKFLELWRIRLLSDVSFLPCLINLVTLSLVDLRNLKTLPDLHSLKKLQSLELKNVPIEKDSLNISSNVSILHI